MATLYFITDRVAQIVFRASWFWITSAQFRGTWVIFSSPADSKITPDGIGLQWNGQSKTFWALTFELLGRNIAPPYFKTERVAETAIRASWFWPTMARSSKTWVMVSSPGDSKITPAGLGFGLDARKFCCVHFTANQGHQELVKIPRDCKISPKFREIEPNLSKLRCA